MQYTITCYNNALQADILALPDGLSARYLALTDRMENYGANLGEPHTKAFGNGLFELRLKSRRHCPCVLLHPDRPAHCDVA